MLLGSCLEVLGHEIKECHFLRFPGIHIILTKQYFDEWSQRNATRMFLIHVEFMRVYKLKEEVLGKMYPPISLNPKHPKQSLLFLSLCLTQSSETFWPIQETF